MKLARYWRLWLAPAVALLAWSVALLRGGEATRLELHRQWAGASWSLPFGADEGGVDLLAYVALATAQVLVLAAAVATSGWLLGTALGSWAGFRGGRAQALVTRSCDLVQSFPSFLLALAVLAAVRTPERWHLALVFGLTAWAPYARLAAIQAQRLAAAQFVEAARSQGASTGRVLWLHVVPNLVGPVTVQWGSSAAGVVLGESALSFVGLGPGDGVSLGALLDQGTLSMLAAPHVLTIGAISIMVVSGALQLLSEGLRQVVLGASQPH